MNRLICYKCRKQYEMNKRIWNCDCGGFLDISFSYEFKLDSIKKRPPNLWRYREAIPIIDCKNIISFNEGFTPFISMDFDGREVLMKQDYLFPTGSFKDRGATVLVSKINELGIKKVVEDSSGNAGAALSAYCRKAGIECEVFLPDYTPLRKLKQIEFYGAKLNKIKGTREDTAYAARSRAKNVYYASHHWNPFFLHGTKTFAFEVAEQLGWESPDTVILPVGSGSLMLGVYIGFSELVENGIIEKIPRLIGVQTENCAPLVRAFRSNSVSIPRVEIKETIAEGISIGNPIRGEQILKAVRDSKGLFIEVSEDEIKEALRWICRRGYYIEVTSAAVIAGISKYIIKSKPNEIIVSIFTSHGLKNSEKISELLT